jgi:hypothetical protein
LFSVLCGRCGRVVLLPGLINDGTEGIGVSRTSDGVGQLSEETDQTMFIEHRVYKIMLCRNSAYERDRSSRKHHILY